MGDANFSSPKPRPQSCPQPEDKECDLNRYMPSIYSVPLSSLPVWRKSRSKNEQGTQATTPQCDTIIHTTCYSSNCGDIAVTSRAAPTETTLVVPARPAAAQLHAACALYYRGQLLLVQRLVCQPQSQHCELAAVLVEGLNVLPANRGCTSLEQLATAHVAVAKDCRCRSPLCKSQRTLRWRSAGWI